MTFFKKRPYIFFLLPGVLLYTLFIIYPMVSAIPYSFTKWAGVGPFEFVGFNNFKLLFTHPQLSQQFFNAIKNNVVFLVINIVIVNSIQMALAYLIFKKIPGHKVFTTVIFSPHFLNAVAIGFMFTLFFDPMIGLYSTVMRTIGLGQHATFPWISDPNYGIAMVALVCAWKGIGYCMLLYIANLNMIPTELEEAATIDGASELKRIIHIYLPLMAPSLNNVLVLTYIWSISAFDIPYIIAGVNGGVGRSMDLMGVFFYRTVFNAKGGFGNNFMGMGSTISVVMLGLIAIGSFIITTIMNKKHVEY